tara:strand:- start:1083 stop:2078 length:996 start_codon:yes stop_codon:yes gene_type:complete
VNKIKVGLSIGDPNGVGLEVILKAFEDKSLYESMIPILFASRNIVESQKVFFKSKIHINYIKNIKYLKEETLNVFEIPLEHHDINFGVQSKKAGVISAESLKRSINAIKKGIIDVLVTAPINKKSIQSQNFKFPGHTDYLDLNFDGDSLMFMISGSLRIALVTDHIPVKRVSKTITNELLALKIRQVQLSLKNDFGISKPKLALLGLNPHSGDNGVIGNEEDLIIKPIILETNINKIEVHGPFPADSFFASKKHKEYDAIIAMYHDQGLIPFKMLSFGKGVNFTAGLNLIRTSPDHGTCFDIAGKGIVNSNSFKEAILESIRIFKSRHKRD